MDAIGTVKLSSSGNGYKEQPTAEFSYGLDGNLTQDLIDTGKSVATRADLNDSLGQSSHGQLRFVEDESLVYSFHFSRPDSDTTWRDDQPSRGLGDVYKRQPLDNLRMDSCVMSKMSRWFTVFISRAPTRTPHGAVSYTHLTLPTMIRV